MRELAKRLDVTRGSFYHHFKDRADLLQTMLDFWFAHYTTAVRDELQQLDLDPQTTLRALVRIIRGRWPKTYNTAVRAWALHDPLAARVVQKVDEVRLGFVRQQFRRLGFRGIDAELRTRMFAYYEWMEPASFAKQSNKLKDDLIEPRLELLTKR